MKKIIQISPAPLLVVLLAVSAYGQVPTPTPDLSGAIESTDPRMKREQALVKLLEGQRYMWKMYRLQTQAGRANQMALAKPAFQKAVELDPTLAEAYTALAEISVATPPGDLDVAIDLASRAVKASPQNFGAHRILARFFTIKSRLNNGPLDSTFADRAVAEWREVSRLDPRNAEAWAFLSAFAEARNQPEEEIRALRGWVSSVPPLEEGFYERRMGGASLAPESASVKLAGALVKAGKGDEAASLLSELIADNAENAEAIAMLNEVIGSTDAATANKTIGALQQAIYANPSNVSLIDMLSRLQSRLGRMDDAVSLLKKHIADLKKSDKRASSTLSIALGELFLEKDRYDEAAGALENALVIRGIGEAPTLPDDEREFAVYVFEKLIHVSKLANKPDAARGYIEKARKTLKKEDQFSDRQMVQFLQASGNRKEALALVRSLREKSQADPGLLRQEAILIADLGQVDAAVDLIRKGGRTTEQPPLVGGSSSSGTIAGPIPGTDAFSDLLFISNLYIRANRGGDAIAAANKAISTAAGSERKQIGMTALATAQQTSGDFPAAERTLREVLKISPANPMALNNLGYFLVERGERLDEATEMIKQAVKVDPTNPSYLDSLGWAYFKLGKLAEAEKYLSDAARLDADSSTIREHLGDVFKEKREMEKARSYWDRALRLSSETAEIERLKKKLGK